MDDKIRIALQDIIDKQIRPLFGDSTVLLTLVARHSAGQRSGFAVLSNDPEIAAIFQVDGASLAAQHGQRLQ
jgi:hypothetical protein